MKNPALTTIKPDESMRYTVGNKVLEMAADLAARAEHMAEQVDGALAPVSMPSDVEKDGAGMLLDTWPPMYEDLRGYFLRIERSISMVHKSLDRAELPK